MHPKELRTRYWNDVAAAGFELPTVEFYGHASGHYRSFSNFYEHAAFVFSVPECCGRAALLSSGRAAERRSRNSGRLRPAGGKTSVRRAVPSSQ